MTMLRLSLGGDHAGLWKCARTFMSLRKVAPLSCFRGNSIYCWFGVEFTASVLRMIHSAAEMWHRLCFGTAAKRLSSSHSANMFRRS